MELREALIPAIVQNAKVETDTHDVTGMGGQIVRQVVTGRRIKLEIEVLPRNNDELNWLWQSLQENGNRIALIPVGSPIIHPGEAMAKIATPIKTDLPQTIDPSW